MVPRAPRSSAYWLILCWVTSSTIDRKTPSDEVDRFGGTASATAISGIRNIDITSTMRKWKFARDSSRVCRSEEHTSELQSLMRISYAVLCLKKKNINNQT